MSVPEVPVNSSPIVRPILPDQTPTFRHLDPAAALAFRTPLQEHPPAADTKASALLTAMGIMFPLLAKFDKALSSLIVGHPALAAITYLLLLGFACFSLGVVVQAFRTFSPRFPKAAPSLAFFHDIASHSREDYIQKVQGLSHQQALAEICAYNHNLSKICVEKFAQLSRAIRLFQGAFLCWITLMLLIFLGAKGG